MKLTAKAQATLRNLIICRQTQLDTRLAGASNPSARVILMDEHDSILALWDEIEQLKEAEYDDDDVDDNATAVVEVAARPPRKRGPGRPPKKTTPVVAKNKPKEPAAAE